MKLFGGCYHLATRHTRPDDPGAPKEKSAYGRIRCSTLYGALGLIFLSCALFVGTTFAWFTDNSSGATAQIMGGTLSVKLVIEDTDTTRSSLDNIIMTRTTPSNSADNVWNPRDTFETPPMHVENTGDLPIEYKLIVIPATGLENAVTFKIEYAETNGVSPDAENIQRLDAADTAPVPGTSFRIVGTVADANAAAALSGQRIEKPFRLIVLARQSGEPCDDDWWPNYCTDESHASKMSAMIPSGAKSATNANSVPAGITVSHDPETPCHLIYTCATCGEVLKKDVLDVQVHAEQGQALFAQYEVGAEFQSEDFAGSENTYTKTLVCEHCNDFIGTLHVTTETLKTEEETELTEIIMSVKFNYKDASIEDLEKLTPAQP